MRSRFRLVGIMITVLAVAGLFTGCAPRRLSAGPVPALPPLAATPDDLKVIVAMVNGAEITRYSLIEVMNHMSAANERTSLSGSREETRKKALDRLIFEELAFQEARRQGLHVGEDALDRAMGTLRANLGSEEAYNTFIATKGISGEELRSQVERVLLLRLIDDQEVIKKTSVADEDVRKAYERHKDRFIVPGKVTVDDVVLFLDQDDPAAMAKANEILARINADKDQDPSNLAVDGTFIVQRIDLNKEKEPALYDAARKLKEGELSGVIRASDSLHIIRLTEYLPEKQKSYEEVKGRLEAELKVAAQKERRRAWDRELRKGAKIEILDPEGGKAD